MSSVGYLREFVNERLTAAAEEIFGVFQKTIFEYEEELGRQRRLLDNCIVWKPEVNVNIVELPQQHVCQKEAVLAVQQQLCVQKRNSSLDQEDPDPPQIKEEQEERCTSQKGEQLVMKQETDDFMFTPTYEESDHSEDQTLDMSTEETQRAVEEINYISVNSSASEPNSDHQLLSHNSHVAESQDQKRGKHGDSGSTRNAEPKTKKRHRKSRSHSKNVNNPDLSEIHHNTDTEKLSSQRTCISCNSSFNTEAKLCPSCGTSQPHAGQPRKARATKRLETFKAKSESWAEAIKRNRNMSRVRGSTQVMMEKLKALGLRPLLLLGKYDKRREVLRAECLCPYDLPEHAKEILERIEMLYNALLEGWTPPEEDSRQREVVKRKREEDPAIDD